MLIVEESSACEAGRVESALVVLIVVESSSCAAGRAACGWIQLLRSWTCLICWRAENCCVQALEKPDKLRAESQLVNSLDQLCAQLSRS